MRTPLNVLVEHFALQGGIDPQQMLFEPRYNIAPTQEVLAVRQPPAGGRRELVRLRWGLLPAWSKQPSAGPPLINARAETLAEKPAFRAAFRQRRCLIPADGFYEWQEVPGGKKQPFYIHRHDHGPFALAGLWERSENGPALESCTIVTTSASDALATLHDRMPVILSPGDYALWLDPSATEPATLQHLLAPWTEELVAEPVSPRVNRVANDDAECIEALAADEPAAEQRMLF